MFSYTVYRQLCPSVTICHQPVSLQTARHTVYRQLCPSVTICHQPVSLQTAHHTTYRQLCLSVTNLSHYRPHTTQRTVSCVSLSQSVSLQTAHHTTYRQLCQSVTICLTTDRTPHNVPSAVSVCHNLSHYRPHTKLLRQSAEYSKLTAICSNTAEGINAHVLYLTGFNSELFTIYMTRHRHNLGGRGNAPPPKKKNCKSSFSFWVTKLRGKEKQKYFLNDYLCGVKTETNEKPAFRRTQNKGNILIPTVLPPPPTPHPPPPVYGLKTYNIQFTYTIKARSCQIAQNKLKYL